MIKITVINGLLLKRYIKTISFVILQFKMFFCAKMSTIYMCYISVLEVYQFARDAAVAEAWLIAQEPYLQNMDLGVRFHFI